MLDTNVISDLMRNPGGVAAQHVQHQARRAPSALIMTSLIVQCELLFGLAKRPSVRWQQRYDDVIEAIEVRPLDLHVAKAYAHLRAALERNGAQLGANDLLIAAHAQALGATLVSADAAFALVPGLVVANWLISPIPA